MDRTGEMDNGGMGPHRVDGGRTAARVRRVAAPVPAPILGSGDHRGRDSRGGCGGSLIVWFFADGSSPPAEDTGRPRTDARRNRDAYLVAAEGVAGHEETWGHPGVRLR
jgi:hypothetical protein